MIECRTVGWWYWLGMVALLTAGLSGWSFGFTLAILLGGLQVIHFAWREWNPIAFSVQVRLAYLGLLTLAQLEPLFWIYWVQVIGTSVRLLTGYCLLARTVSLFPWNRLESLSKPLVYRTYFTFGPMVATCGGFRSPSSQPWHSESY